MRTQLTFLFLALVSMTASAYDNTAKSKYQRERESVESCKKSGGKANPHTENGCRYVSCVYKDAAKNYANLIDHPKAANCAPGFVK